MKCKCKHKSTTGYMWRAHRFDGRAWIFDWQRAFTQPGDLKHHDRVICDSCGAWLSLGEANDTPEAMVELRAAAIASRGRDAASMWLANEMSDCERDGWEMHMRDWDHIRIEGAEWAGYLARCIATHSEDA